MKAVKNGPIMNANPLSVLVLLINEVRAAPVRGQFGFQKNDKRSMKTKQISYAICMHLLQCINDGFRYPS